MRGSNMQDQLIFSGNEATRFRSWSRLLSRATINKLLSSGEMMVGRRDCSRGITTVLRTIVFVLFVWSLIFSPGLARAQGDLDSQSGLSSRDWEGSWEMQFEYEGQWHSAHLTMTATEGGIRGDYDFGRLRGTFDPDDVTV